MSNVQECHFCGLKLYSPCRSTRDMKDADATICFAALMMHGGGEYTEDRRLAQELMRRAGVVRKEPRDADPR